MVKSEYTTMVIAYMCMMVMSDKLMRDRFHIQTYDECYDSAKVWADDFVNFYDNRDKPLVEALEDYFA